MNKKISLILTLIIIISTIFIPNIKVDAGILGTRKLGIAVDVIDGEALVVKFNNTDVFVKLIGVNTNASEEAFQYVNTNVKGKYVWVLTEDFVNAEAENSKFLMSYVYMYDSGEMLNKILIEQGLAQVKTTDTFSVKFDDFIVSQNYAKSKKVGIWQTDKNQYYYSGDCTNINTATSSQLKKLTGITSSLASNIISYRKENPFNNIKELKFVKGITKKIYDDIYNDITVVTNINVATEHELLTLDGLTQKDVDSILDYRGKDKSFTRLEQFYKNTDLTAEKYNRNKYFISLDYEENIDYRIDDRVININTASASQIRNASGSVISTSSANKIINNRKKGYTYKALMEILHISDISITETDMNKVEDNFNLHTDINNADTEELRSLFGSSYVSSDIDKIKSKRPFYNISEIRDIIGTTKYNEIKDFIYVNEYIPVDRININLATSEQLKDLPLTSNELKKLSDKYKKMKTSNDLPFDVTGINDTISLYTNINTATEKELETVYSMSNSIINNIIKYREEQPFGSLSEVEQFFADQNQRSLYNNIKDFIVVR